MNKIQAYWNKKIVEGQRIAAALHVETGFVYRVRHLFNGVNIEAKSNITGTWFIVKTIR
jgi:hypothetical protein